MGKKGSGDLHGTGQGHDGPTHVREHPAQPQGVISELVRLVDEAEGPEESRGALIGGGAALSVVQGVVQGRLGRRFRGAVPADFLAAATCNE